MITKVYPDSGLKAKDFKVGDQVVIQDPRGDAEAFKQGKFKLGDICTVTSIGENILYFNKSSTCMFLSSLLGTLAQCIDILGQL